MHQSKGILELEVSECLLLQTDVANRARKSN